MTLHNAHNDHCFYSNSMWYADLSCRITDNLNKTMSLSLSLSHNTIFSMHKINIKYSYRLGSWATIKFYITLCLQEGKLHAVYARNTIHFMAIVRVYMSDTFFDLAKAVSIG